MSAQLAPVLPEEAFMDNPDDSGERRLDTKWMMNKYVEQAEEMARQSAALLNLEKERDQAKNRTKQIAIGAIASVLLIGLFAAPDEIKALIPFLGKLLL